MLVDRKLEAIDAITRRTQHAAMTDDPMAFWFHFPMKQSDTKTKTLKPLDAKPCENM